MDTIQTRRLLLRPWQETDLTPFAQINADKKAMQHFPACLSREESDRRAREIMDHFKEKKFGLYAAEFKRNFIGFVGLNTPLFEADFMPCIEIGWRLAPTYWGQGLATEAAMAVRDYGFHVLNLKEIVAFASPGNLGSIRVMEKIGMTRVKTFEHPSLPLGHELRTHLLYRMTSNKTN